LNQKAQEPREFDTYRATNAPQGDPLTQEALKQSALLGTYQVLG
jgi:hypothetical protein